MLRVTLLNPKGGCGKTTLATNLASYYANLGQETALIDYDAQGSSSRWLDARPGARPAIYGVAAYRDASRVTRSWQLRLPPRTERAIVDTPASVAGPALDDLIARSDRILVPVLASAIDLDAFSTFIARLKRYPRVRGGDVRVGVVANRVKRNTRFLRTLIDALEGAELECGYHYVAHLRDTQRYVRAGQRGLGLTELDDRRTEADVQQWKPLLEWLEKDPSGGGSGRVDRGPGDRAGDSHEADGSSNGSPGKQAELPFHSPRTAA